MSTPFLLGFAAALVEALLEQELLEVHEGREREVVRYVAEWLGTKARGGSLVSSTARALVECPDVDEIYADNDQLKALMETLRYGG